MRVLILTLAALVAPAAGSPVLAPQRLYCTVGRPVPVTVRPPAAGDAALVLLRPDGAVVAGPRTVEPGPADAGGLLPELRSLRRVAYLQCLLDGRPVGSALVIQPLLAPRGPDAVPDGSAPHPGDGAPPEPEPEEATAPPRVFSGLRVYPERDVVLHTDRGDVVLALRPDEAPNTAFNFRHLVAGGFYDGLVFHRVIPLTRRGHPFVVQSGDPTGTGAGGPGYRLPLERSGLPHDFGVVSMARGDRPDSAGSQFFICLSREGTARLDGRYCAFAEAVAGAETIRALADVELADAGAGLPVEPPVILRAELVPAPPRASGRGRPDRPVAEQSTPDPAPPPVRVPR